ncbi:gamma-glutamylcyclotransferase [Cereibacter azotoformans]|uniref:gamma-glutamylcyclotransferase n=1 Tax=Cereibacter azotoformans TaxID=43057 RepID=UPI000E35DAE1|nr:gamma-glutamylcyclotransferase [Cereibacter azotoformans]AXQ94090.1 gamma-glutamylcyclotransferase [Cereibacter sphaeroides]UIJ29624.1 gamma-glutamylcyclotransferase [Cereibacter azotoformans]
MPRPLWVFGYGSLIWNPGFPVEQSVTARLDGWRRSFCMTSIHYRGTLSVPGLVLALDAAPGEGCAGVAFRAATGTEAETLAALRERELISRAYLEQWLPVELTTGETVEALVYVIDPAHQQYCGHLDLETQARIIARAAGERGPNRDYLLNTVAHLEQLGIDDPDLCWLATRVRALGNEPAS